MGELDEDREVENALRSYPLAPAPPTLAPNVITRIHRLAPLPRFRLSWVDFAVSAFVAGMGGLGFILWQTLPPQLTPHIQLEFLRLTQQSNGPILQNAILGGAGLAVFAVFVAALVFARTRSSSAS
ncbi:MAG: hypothetical protein HYZ49_16820 [Chloroflexi bacterium]|nr:hypothetical protein [Chloroflexota bacterium]